MRAQGKGRRLGPAPKWWAKLTAEQRWLWVFEEVQKGRTRSEVAEELGLSASRATELYQLGKSARARLDIADRDPDLIEGAPISAHARAVLLRVFGVERFSEISRHQLERIENLSGQGLGVRTAEELREELKRRGIIHMRPRAFV